MQALSLIIPIKVVRIHGDEIRLEVIGIRTGQAGGGTYCF